MSSAAITTIVKMMESLPEDLQTRVVEHLREYIDDLQDELQWDESFLRTQQGLVAAAQRAKQEITEGQVASLQFKIRSFKIHALRELVGACTHQFEFKTQKR